jgi:catechol 2,3-dioxygenase-like lactoylglutathione lyase family enzyme
MSSPYVNVLIIYSKNLNKAKEFYNKLGLDFIYHKHGSSPKHLVYKQKGIVFEIYPLSNRDTPTSSLRLGFKVDSVDTIFDNHQINPYIVSTPSLSQWGRVARLRDPDNHTIDLFESELL